MKSLNEYVEEYKKQLEKGNIQNAYRGLMEYLMSLRTHFKNKYPDYFVSGNIYYGYMDMSYFSFTPESLKRKKLKIAIVFIHDTIQFEVWLGGYNKQVQAKYWKLFKESNYNQHNVPASVKDIDFIVDHTLVDNPNFNKLDALTNKIEDGTLKFIKDIEIFLSKNSN